LEFRARTEPFLLLREIELQIRRLLVTKITGDDMTSILSQRRLAAQSDSVSDLTFGDYIRLMQHPSIWHKLQLAIDQSELTKSLDDVRKIRNDVMHFDLDGLTDAELETLKQTTRFLQEVHEILSGLK